MFWMQGIKNEMDSRNIRPYAVLGYFLYLSIILNSFSDEAETLEK